MSRTCDCADDVFCDVTWRLGSAVKIARMQTVTCVVAAAVPDAHTAEKASRELVRVHVSGRDFTRSAGCDATSMKHFDMSFPLLATSAALPPTAAPPRLPKKSDKDQVLCC